jgi:hypothetical protein
MSDDVLRRGAGILVSAHALRAVGGFNSCGACGAERHTLRAQFTEQLAVDGGIDALGLRWGDERKRDQCKSDHVFDGVRLTAGLVTAPAGRGYHCTQAQYSRLQMRPTLRTLMP